MSSRNVAVKRKNEWIRVDAHLDARAMMMIGSRCFMLCVLSLIAREAGPRTTVLLEKDHRSAIAMAGISS